MTHPPHETGPDDEHPSIREDSISRADYERDLELARAITSFEQLKRTTESIRVKVKEHETILQQGKGMLIAGRIFYVIIGVLVSGIVWFFATIRESKPESPPPKPVPTAQAHRLGETELLLVAPLSCQEDASVRKDGSL